LQKIEAHRSLPKEARYFSTFILHLWNIFYSFHLLIFPKVTFLPIRKHQLKAHFQAYRPFNVNNSKF